MKYVTLLLFGVLLFTNPAQAWQPDPGCTAVKYPVPSVRSCGDLADKYLIAQKEYEKAADTLAKWGGLLGDLEKELTNDMIERSIDALNPIPTDATSIAGCFLDICKKGLGIALTFGDLAIGHAKNVGIGLRAGNAYRAHAKIVESLRVALEAAGAALEECQQERAVEEADALRVIALNKNANPRYPSDHERCNPPKDEGPIKEEKLPDNEPDDKSNNQDDRGH